MGIFSQVRNRIKDKQMGMAQPVGRGGGFFGGLPFAKERMPIGDMRFRDPRFEGRRRRRGIAGLFGRMPEKVPFGPVSQPEMMAPQMMQPQLFGRPLEGISFSDINIENIPTLPDFSQGLPPEILERIQGNMQRMGRLPFAGGEEASTQSLVDFLNSDPEQIAFGMESQIEKLFQDYMMAKNSGDIPRAKMLNDKINEMQAEIIRLKNMGRTGMAGGGESSFPDLTGDNQVTQADILKGRGVFAEGDEVDKMMMEMENPEKVLSEAEEIMTEGEQLAPAAQMMEQFVQAVIQMIQAGASEQEVIEMLRQAGLDEEDINAVFQAVMQSLQGPGIDQELAALG